MARFSDLPQELRDIIWQFAIRPEGPTAHCLSVRHWHKDDHLVEPNHDHQWSIGDSIENFGPKSAASDTVQFSAPRCGRDGSFSWVLGNYSAYMEDSALWTTCWDSRRHMIQRFRPHETNRRTSRKKRVGDWIPEAATVTAVLQRDNGERQHFTIQPVKDLIILQTLPGSCFSLDQDIDDEVLPEIDWLWDGLRWCNTFAWAGSWRSGTYCHPENIAFEFDHKWMEQIEKYTRKFDEAFYIEFDTIWFIDDRLRLKPEGERPQRRFESKVFNAMGRRFVEVDMRDVVYEGFYEGGSDVFDFVAELEDIHNVLMNRDSPLYHDGREATRGEFKVLACELL